MIHIKSGAVISAGAVLLGPLIIGENAIIAANSVVLTDVPPNTLYAGVPAKWIKSLE